MNLQDGFTDRYEVEYEPIRLRRRPRWKRILRSPRLFMQHYRIVRRHATRWQSVELAARSAVTLWK